MEALDDALLLRIFGATMDAVVGGAEDDAQMAAARARGGGGGDGADDEDWHPAHLARLACVSR
jgi:hypothetical protein